MFTCHRLGLSVSSINRLASFEMKPINDRLGHEVEDQALKELSTILKCNLRDSDLIARHEFCVLLTGSETEVETALEMITSHVTNRNTYDAENHYNLQFSAGTVFFNKDLHKNIDDI